MKARVGALLSIVLLLAIPVIGSMSARAELLTVLPTPDYMVDITSAIRSASKSIFAAFFFVEPYSTNTVINELANAKARGVAVKLVVSTHSLVYYSGVKERLTELGIPFRIATNHAKVVVIDDSLLYIGSANWNMNGLQNNMELTYKSRNTAAISEAKGYINTLWSTGKTSVKYTAAMAEQPVNGQEYVDQVISLLKNAKTSIKFSMYEVVYDFKNPSSAQSKLLWELKNAYQRGVDVQIVLDNPRYYEHPAGANFLAKYKIPHKIDAQTFGPLEKKHMKAFLIDDKILVIGSHNWNSDSANSSNEYSIIVRGNADANREFNAWFAPIWNTGIWVIAPSQ